MQNYNLHFDFDVLGKKSCRVGKLEPVSRASLEMCFREMHSQTSPSHPLAQPPMAPAGPELLGAPVAPAGAILVVPTTLLAAVGGCVMYEMCTYSALPNRQAVTANLK